MACFVQVRRGTWIVICDDGTAHMYSTELDYPFGSVYFDNDVVTSDGSISICLDDDVLFVDGEYVIFENEYVSVGG